MYFVVHTSNDPAGAIAAVKSAIQTVDKDQPVYNIKSMDDYLSGSVAKRRFSMLLFGIFAAVAMLLAAVGLYGVMSYSVTQRTHEIGVRMALGAGRADVLKMIVGHGFLLTVIGVAIGVAGALLLTGFMKDLLFGVKATDLAVFTAIPLVLAIVALGACFVPALRATKVDPMVALRYE
jgi:putative ABC transport system permease protein